MFRRCKAVMVRLGAVGHGSVWLGSYGKASYGKFWLGNVRQFWWGGAGYGMAGYGKAVVAS